MFDFTDTVCDPLVAGYVPYPHDALVYVDDLQKYPWEALSPKARSLGRTHMKIRTWAHVFGRDKNTVCELALTCGMSLRLYPKVREIRGITVYWFWVIPSMREKTIQAGAIQVPSIAGKVREWIKE